MTDAITIDTHAVGYKPSGQKAAASASITASVNGMKFELATGTDKKSLNLIINDKQHAQAIQEWISNPANQKLLAETTLNYRIRTNIPSDHGSDAIGNIGYALRDTPHIQVSDTKDIKLEWVNKDGGQISPIAAPATQATLATTNTSPTTPTSNHSASRRDFVHFDHGSRAPGPQGKKEVADVVDEIKKNIAAGGHPVVVVEGHATGSDSTANQGFAATRQYNVLKAIQGGLKDAGVGGDAVTFVQAAQHTGTEGAGVAVTISSGIPPKDSANTIMPTSVTPTTSLPKFGGNF